MGISSALYSGVSGMNTNGQAMSVIGDNLANTNTIGFKGSRSIFSDLLSSTVSGSGGSSQIGRGVGMSTIDGQFSQGTFEATESNLDLAIEGEGFFILREEETSQLFYSRAGSFRFNAEGFLVSPEGIRVQGKQFDVNGDLVAGDASDIQVAQEGLIEANATTTLTLNTNVDSSVVPIDDGAGGALAIDITDPTTYHYSNSVTIFDSQGNSHILSTYFQKTVAADNTWNWAWSTEDSLGAPIEGVGAAPIVFDEDGLLDTGGIAIIGGAGIDWANGTDLTNVELTFDITQFDNKSVTISQTQDGYGAGELIGVTVDGEGIVRASYSNGELTEVAQLVLSRFKNPNGLLRAGSNLFTESGTSGVPRVGFAGAELGNIFTNSLEMSNVDMGAEFVKMITVQRGFQANSKIITTVDELLGELINLKR